VLFGIAFSIMLVPYTDDVGDAASEVGAAMFTLGLARSARFTNDTIVIAAAASGFVVIALQIAYLPALYAAFNRRESLITMLASRAGEPSWGPEILIRHQLVGIVDSLPDFYGQWEQWAATSPSRTRRIPCCSSVARPVVLVGVALLSVLGAPRCSCVEPDHRRVAGAAVVGWATPHCAGSRRARLSYEPDPLPDDPILLTPGRVQRAVRLLQEVGFATEASPTGVGALPGGGVNYEDLAYRWAARVMAPPAPWSGPRPGLGPQVITPQRPPHRSPDTPEPGLYRRPDFDA
jgi:hypothetical protein